MSDEKKREQEEAGLEEGAGNEIAVVGMALRVPGADTPEAYWENLRSGTESIRHWTVEELEEAGVAPELLRDPRYVRASGVLDDISGFDAGFFGVSAKDAGIMDPQHRLFLECAWEALERTGHTATGFPGAVGVFGGCGMGTYFIHNILSNPDLVNSVGWFLLRHTNNDKDFLSTFVSYKMNLTGPSVNVQTACSTSLVAIHAACQSLLSRECDMALAGGSTLNVPHEVGYLYQEGEILSPDGHCRAFDAQSAGTVFGNGSGVVALRRLEDAIEDGDPIRAIIRGSAINNDGSQKAGYLAPSVEGQAAAIAEAISVAGVSAEEIGYVEAHGTGTSVGDPIEVAALTQAFRETSEGKGYCGLGSVKPNIGHLDTAAGVASFIKVVLALEHGEIPPSPHYERPNPAIDFDTSPFYVNAEHRVWESEAPRIAGVSSLGVGGTNAHVILEEPPPPEPSGAGRAVQLLPLSARTPAALAEASQRLAEHLRANPDVPLADAAWTLQVGRKPLDHRKGVVCRTVEEAIARLETPDKRTVASGQVAGPSPSTAFLLPGGGAQYPRMGLGLYEDEPIVREHVDRGLEILRTRFDLDLRDVWFPEDAGLEAAAETFQRPALQLPAIFILEYALAKLWMSFGVKPQALIGHSMGENTAACLAGVMSFEDALGLVTLRGRLFETTEPGGMMSLSLPADRAAEYVAEDTVLASVNGPSLCVISGSDAAIDRLEKRLAEDEVDHQRVRISVAAHSPLLDPILEEFGAYLRSIELHPPEIPIVSNRTGTWLSDDQATNPDYWVQHLRHTVHFADGVGTLLETPGRVLLEVGPGKTLGSLARQHASASPGQPVVSSLRHPEEAIADADFFHLALGRVWIGGASVDWEQYHRGEDRQRLTLPTYPFERQRYWIEPGTARYEAPAPVLPIEKLTDPDDWFRRPAWHTAPPPGKSAAEEEPRTWLFFLDAAGIGSELVARLRGAGHRVVTVKEGDAFYRFGDDDFALAPEAGRDGYDQLVQALNESEALPDRIVHLWLVTADESARAGSSFFHRNQERGFYSLLFLMQALAGEDSSGARRIDLLSTGLHSVSGEALPHPDKATVFGPLRVIPHEFPEVRCRNVDVEVPGAERASGEGSPMAALLDRLLGELGEGATADVVAYRGDVRFEQTLEKLAPETLEAGGTPLRDGGAYLVTGGLGGIGFAVAEQLAERAKARLVLLSRRGFPEREAWDAWLERHGERDGTSERIRRIRRLEAAGAEVWVATGDVANIERMREVVREAEARFGPLHGVFHAAGTIEDGVIPMKSPEAAERVFTPKVHGTLVFAELFADSALDFLVLFSSTSTVLGPPGQVDYTGANAFLDAFAASRRGAPGPRTVTVGWGVWNEVGMARQIQRGLRGDDVDAGAEHLRVAHPLLDERIDLGGGRTLYASELSPQDRWVLDEHRLKDGRAVWPGTGYLELARAAASDLLEGAAFGLEGVQFLAPLEVPDDGERRIELELERDGDVLRFEIRSRDLDAEEGASAEPVLHAQGRVRPGAPEPAASLDVPTLAAACTGDLREGTDLASDQDVLLAFGPRWRCLERTGFGEGRALARLALSSEFSRDLDDHHLHPALLDLATGFALRLVPGYEPGEQLYVPLSYDRVAIHAPLERELVSHVRARRSNQAGGETAAFDVTLADLGGRVLVEVTGFTMRRIAGPRALEAAPPSAGPSGTSAAERVFLESFEAGIRVDEGMAALERILGHETPAQVLVSSIDLDLLRKRHAEVGAEEQAGAGVKFARPSLASEYVEPRDEIEEALVALWEELLGVDPIGVEDDFFELGGHSLIAVRLFAAIKKKYGVEFPLSVLFDAPTVAACAELLREEVGEASEGEAPKRRRRAYDFLVPMNDVKEATKAPFFLVSGMFGNVLNLRHLAAHLGEDQPVFAIQARGLYGDEEPHTRFEDMARDYLREIRTVQPEGPYFLGGFSGGGLTAFEMAHQLRAEGEEVATVILLDTPAGPIRRPNGLERARIQLQRLRRLGPGYLVTWARNRVRWELERLTRRAPVPEIQEVTPAEFRSGQIEGAFREALDHYTLRRYEGGVALFRPALDTSHPLGRGRVANERRELVDPLNFWGPYAESVHLEEVPGDHDGMVLEPYVRVLGAKMRAVIEAAQAAAGNVR